MAAIIEVKFFNTFILKKTNTIGSTTGDGAAMWNGSFGVPASIGGYPRTSPQLADLDNDAGNWAIEEARIKGGYNNTSTDYGAKAYLVEDKPNQSKRVNTLIYSGIFNSRTGINNTNVFSVGEDITKSLDPANGSIQKLYAEDTNLNIFQELKVSRALIDKDAIYAAEGGGTAVSSFKTVIGQIVPYAGEYGISTNPESFAIYGYNKYFADANKNVILKLSQSGIDEISSVGMKDYFRDELNRIKVAFTPGRIIGGWDVYTSQYFVSTQKNIELNDPNPVNINTTVAWDERIKGWTSFFSFTPDQIFSIRNKMYTTQDGKLWLHNSNENLITQATTSNAVNNNAAIPIDNIQGDLRKGDIVSGIGVASGTFIVNITISATTFIQVNTPQTLQNNVLLSFSSLARNKFYGVNNNSNITFVFNDNASVSKNFKTIEYEGYNGWQVDSFISDPTGEDELNNSYSFSNDSTSQVLSYEEGQYSLGGQRFSAGFNRKENKYYAYLKNTSEPVAGEIHFGDQMTGIKGFYAVVTVSTDSTSDLGGEKQLFQVGTEYSFNNGFYQNG
jgi:hypothetical protein